MHTGAPDLNFGVEGRPQFMPVSTQIVGLLCAGTVVAWLIRNSLRMPEPFQHRSCQGTKWHRAFPQTKKQDIRTFLKIFTDAFAFHDRMGLHFEPADSILEIYRALYPYKWMPDALELETFASRISKAYGITLSEVWSDKLTLGELFSLTQGKTSLQ